MLALYISLLDTEEQISKFEHIYTKYRGLMFYTAKGVLQDSYLAEDAVHETFLDIIRIIDHTQWHHFADAVPTACQSACRPLYLYQTNYPSA